MPVVPDPPYRAILMRGDRFVAVELTQPPDGHVMDVLREALDSGMKVGQGQVTTTTDIIRIFAGEQG